LTSAAIAALAISLAGCVAPALPFEVNGLADLVPASASGTPASLPDAAPSFPSAVRPGGVNRTSDRLATRYTVDVQIQPASERVISTIHLSIENRSGRAIDHVVLRSAETLPFRAATATVGGREVTVRRSPGRLRVGLGGVLRAGSSIAVQLRVVLGLGKRVIGHGYFHAFRGGVIQLSEWLPRVSPVFSDRIRARIRAPDGWTVAVGALDHSREVAIAASRSFRTLRTRSAGIRVRVLYQPGRARRAAALATVREVRRVLPWIRDRLGPSGRGSVTIAQVNSDGLAYSWPGMIWLPDNLSPAGVRLYVAHELAHQWFGGVASTRDPLGDPFAAEGPAELISRLWQRALRPSACPSRRLDLPKAAYGGCFYEAIYVDGANVLNRVRRLMGDRTYWRALRGYMRSHRFGPVGTRDLLDAFQRASPVKFRPLLRKRFPSKVS
jgi:hypothetical protein